MIGGFCFEKSHYHKHCLGEYSRPEQLVVLFDLATLTFFPQRQCHADVLETELSINILLEKVATILGKKLARVMDYDPRKEDVNLNLSWADLLSDIFADTF